MSADPLIPGPSREGLHEQTIARLNNQGAQTAAGFEAHPYSYARSHSAAELLAAHPGSAEAPLESGQTWPEETYALAGRVMSFRHMGGAAFADVQDQSGTVQVYFGKKVTEQFAATKHIDLGDLLGVSGTPFVTKTGQLTLEVHAWQPLVKSLHPLPSKFHGLQDDELRATFNGGLGMVVVIAPDAVQAATSWLATEGIAASLVGRVVPVAEPDGARYTEGPLG